MNPLIEDRALLRERLLSSYIAVKNLDSVDESRMGAMGYCFGGLCVLDLARSVPESLKGVVSLHGILTGNKLGDSGPITASILIEHGWADPVAPPEHYLEFADEMDSRSADWQTHVHGGAMHAFTFEGANMPENGVQYHEAAARRSWDSLKGFFDEVL